MSRAPFTLALLVACATPQPQQTDRPDAAPEPVDPWALDGGFDLSERPPTPEGIAPIEGGGLVAIDDTRMAAIDVDGDRIVLFDTVTAQHERTIHVPENSRPFRLEHHDGLLIATLAGTHEVVAWNADDGTFAWEAQPCIEPRGVDASDGEIFVACQGGEVAVLDAGDGTLLQRDFLGFDHDDLRDIVVSGNDIYVSRFRSARVLLLRRSDLALFNEWAPPTLDQDAATFNLDPESVMVPRVGWRMIPTPNDDGVLLLHQRHDKRPIPIGLDPNAPVDNSPYGGGGGGHCAGILHSTYTVFGATGPEFVGPVMSLGTVVDVAWPEYNHLIVGGPAPSHIDGTSAHVISFIDETGPCISANHLWPAPMGTTVAVDRLEGRVVDITRQPFAIRVDGSQVTHVSIAEKHPDQVAGWTAFHRSAPARLSCASCHPAGQDDAHTWTFRDGNGPIVRRTPGFGGVLADTAPYHWDAEFENLDDLIREVLVHRMGAEPGAVDGDTLLTWMATIRPPAATTAVLDPGAVSRGGAIFHDPARDCVNCHDGSTLTNNDTVTVGTSGLFQVPTLRGVGSRGPWMHDGCARTLEDRFDPACGGYDHGEVEDLSKEQISDLVAYLRTL